MLGSFGEVARPERLELPTCWFEAMKPRTINNLQWLLGSAKRCSKLFNGDVFLRLMKLVEQDKVALLNKGWAQLWAHSLD